METKDKNVVRINEESLKEMVSKAIKSALKEGYEEENFEYNFPEEIYAWGKKVQALGLEFVRIMGQYRFEIPKEEFEVLRSLDRQYNAVCCDLDIYEIADHYSR